MEQKTITISDARLREAAAQGMDEFLQVFIDRYKEVIGGELSAENMAMLNGEQISLLAYAIFREEVMDGGFIQLIYNGYGPFIGGFIQLIYNGYGPFIFDNPFAKAMRMMGATELAKLINKGKKLYVKYKAELTRERTDEEFMGMFEQYPKFDDLDDAFVEMEEEVTATLACYVDEHLDVFAEIVKE